MPRKLTVELVKQIFEGIGSENPDATFAHIADDVKWTVSNPDPESKTHAFAGFYESAQALRASTLGRMAPYLNEKLCLRIVQEPIVMGNRGVVELQTSTKEGKTPITKNGIRLDNLYSWIFEWDEEKEKIVTVRTYHDSALINQVLG